MSPEVVTAIPALVEQGVLSPATGTLLRRVARDELISLHSELRMLWWLGVTLVVAGVGVLIAQHARALGPLVIVMGLTAGAAGCLWWVWRHGPPFTWQQGESEVLAFDYVLVLGTSLLAADLAYLEVELAPLGGHWPWHLLLGSLISAGLAVRYDSRLLFSLALSTFAAWRGVTASTLTSFAWYATGAETIRLNAVACGALFVAVGALMVARQRKAHFEPVAAHLGWSLLLGSLAQGALAPGPESAFGWQAYAAALLVTGLGLGVMAWRKARFSLFALAVAADYVALSRVVISGLHDGEPILAYFVASGALVVAGLLIAHRALARQHAA